MIEDKIWYIYISESCPTGRIKIRHTCSKDGHYNISDKSWIYPRYCTSCNEQVPKELVTQAYLLL